MPKPFHELTKGEATELAKNVVRTSESDEQIRQRLTEAGFDGSEAAICSMGSGSTYQAMVMVFGPNDEVIGI